MRTEVCITVDTEFSIGGAFADPGKYAPIGTRVVDCPTDGGNEGLDFLLDVLARHDVPATFFVEALNHAYFGDEPMAEVARRIVAAGHDVQLHVHPCWLAFRDPSWPETVRATRPNDSCAGREDDELATIIGQGLAAFQRWGMPRPVALRTGNLHADRTVYKVMKALGLSLASNIGVGIYCPGEANLQLCGGRHWIEGVLELPVLTYGAVRLGPGGGRSHPRALTITATSWAEIKSLLLQARRAGVSPVVVLTHPFEFVKSRDPRYQILRKNRVNQERFGELCRFLQERNQDFVARSFGEAAPEWLAGQETAEPVLGVSPVLALARAAHNYVNDRVWWY